MAKVAEYVFVVMLDNCSSSSNSNGVLAKLVEFVFVGCNAC